MKLTYFSFLIFSLFLIACSKKEPVWTEPEILAKLKDYDSHSGDVVITLDEKFEKEEEKLKLAELTSQPAAPVEEKKTADSHGESAGAKPEAKHGEENKGGGHGEAAAVSSDCDHYGPNCLKVLKKQSHKVKFKLIEYKTSIDAFKDAYKFDQYSSRNWMFDDVQGEPILEKFVIHYLEAKKARALVSEDDKKKIKLNAQKAEHSQEKSHENAPHGHSSH